MEQTKIADSGERRQFETGAQRDIQVGKGRCDLVPLFAASFLFEAQGDVISAFILRSIDSYVRGGDIMNLARAINAFTAIKSGDPAGTAETLEEDIADLILDVSIHYEQGCEKYGERNWEKGIPVHSYIDSGVRHFLKYIRGDRDEAHDRAFVWNLLGAIHTQIYEPGLVDLPCKPIIENAIKERQSQQPQPPQMTEEDMLVGDAESKSV